MSETSPQSALDPLDEQLVAYLDGELSEPERIAVEDRLADDESFRLRLRALEQSWDMLDMLPVVEASDQFTRTTVEMTVVSAEEEAHTQQFQIKRRRRVGLVLGIAGIILVAAVTYVVTMRRLNRENRELVRDLPVIENVDQYHMVEDVEFLKRLAEEGLFVEPVEEEDDVP